MPFPNQHRQRFRQREAMYSFDDYNPYRSLANEQPLIEENLTRLKSGAIGLRAFLRQTPYFARWQESHLQQARVLLVTNEPGLSGMERLYFDLIRASDAESVAECFRATMLSWLALSNHPGLGAIHGELSWVEQGDWEAEHPRLAACGKAGYFLLPGEEAALADCKILHLELSPFAQQGSQDINPRNDQDLEYHRENLETVQRFCRLASPERPRFVFIMADRARIRGLDAGSCQIEAIRTSHKDRSYKIVDLLRQFQSETESGAVRVRLCRHWPIQGRDVEVLELRRATAFELCPVAGRTSEGDKS